jgi:ubiquinone/menaquinone biosynthesis C-methylase UbiE
VTPIHRAAAIGFGRAAADYERGRPGYPSAAIDLLADELGIWPGSRVIDLAAGTGKLTRALVGRGWRLVAVEPVPGMRAQLSAAVPGVKVIEGTAEHLPLRKASVDTVLVAQAFHWFDVEAAAAEIARVLVPRGGLGVIRNVWDRSVGWVDEIQSLIADRRADEPSQTTSRWRQRLNQTRRFTPLADRVVSHVVRSDRAALLARVTSISFVAMLAPAEREQLLSDVSAILDRRRVGISGASLATPYETHVSWARRA